MDIRNAIRREYILFSLDWKPYLSYFQHCLSDLSLMLTIRLARTGRRNIHTFAIYVTEKTNPVSDGNFLEKVGFYQPAREKPELSFNKERIEHWISKGAQPSETLARLLHKQGFAGMDRFVDLKKRYQDKKKVKGPLGGTPSGGPQGGGQQGGGQPMSTAEKKPAQSAQAAAK